MKDYPTSLKGRSITSVLFLFVVIFVLALISFFYFIGNVKPSSNVKHPYGYIDYEAIENFE